MDRPVNPFDRPPSDDEPTFDTGDAYEDDLARFDALADDDVFLADDTALFGEQASAASDAAVGADPSFPEPSSTPPSSFEPVAPATAPAPAASTATAPAASTAPAPGGTATALLEHDDDEPVGLFARTPFAPGAGPRVDLLPGEVVTVRQVRRAQRRGAAALVGVLVLIAAAYVLVSGERAMAREDLAAAQARTVGLTAEQAKYAEAPLVYAEVESTQAALASVMAGDVRWYQFLADLAVTSPPGLWLTSWQATSSDPSLAPTVDPVTGAPAAAVPVANLTVSGTAADEPDVADWLDVLSATPGLTGSTASSLARTAVGQQPVITFDSSAAMTKAALSDRYAAKDPR